MFGNVANLRHLVTTVEYGGGGMTNCGLIFHEGLCRGYKGKNWVKITTDFAVKT